MADHVTPTHTDVSLAKEHVESTPKPENVVVTLPSGFPCAPAIILLATALADVEVPGNRFPVRVLLDSGSQVSFVTETCVQRLKC